MDAARVEVYQSRSMLRAQRWRWRLRHCNGRIIATSGEGYTDRGEAERMGRKVISGLYAP